jgi:2-C-methyl-D-erythritol 4-phosphate cytidylyltransferase
MGGETPKQFLPLAGRPILAHTIERFYRWDADATIVLALPAAQRQHWEAICNAAPFTVAPHHVVDGGETRFHSVRNALAYIEGRFPDTISALIAVHDGVRPLVSTEVISRCFRAAEEQGAAIPVLPVSDSLRCMEADGKSHPVDRSLYRIVQTPQVFRGSILIGAYRQAYAPCFTDDASVVEASGFHIHLVAGNEENIKITTPTDITLAERLMQTIRFRNL